jgi:hypothetical protein
MVPRVSLPLWLFDLQSSSFFFYFSGTAAPEDAFFLRLIWSKFPRIVLDEEDILAVGLSVLNFY